MTDIPVQRCSFDSTYLEVDFVKDEVMRVEWDAVVATVPSMRLIAQMTEASSEHFKEDDYVLIPPNIKEETLNTDIGWHPEMATFANQWVRVEKKSPTTILARLNYMSHLFPSSSITSAVSEERMLRAAAKLTV